MTLAVLPDALKGQSNGIQSLDALKPQFVPLLVEEVIDETDDARSIVFQVPASDPGRFAYRPGQFLTLQLPIGQTQIARCYSLSSAPATDNRLKVTVKRVASGLGSNWICDNVRPGMIIESMPPAGVFTPRTLEGDFLLLAAGSGITPIMSIAKSALSGGRGRVVLVYANRDERSVIFRRELACLTAAYPERLTVIHWLESLQGLPTEGVLAGLVKPWNDAEAFICGPEPFMQAAKAAVTHSGSDSSRIHLERFAAQEQELPRPSTDRIAIEGDVALQVELDGGTTNLNWQPDKFLLDVLLDAGLAAPYSCRLGSCSACMCKVKSGEVTLDQNMVLEGFELAAGWILACQARPASPEVAVSFDSQF